MISLGSLLNEVAANRSLYPLNSLDERLLEAAVTFLAAEAQRYEQDNGELLDALETAFQDAQ